ncbi:MAG: hypothetical protein Q7K03_01945 [Dehalococcoidia bacterium]|nr:hypothetical protein [Dehalococcoidia bacterium]
MPERWNKGAVEAVLFGLGYYLAEDKDGLCWYTRNFYPGYDLVLDFSLGWMEWQDIENQLDFYDIPASPIHDALQAQA